MEKIIYISSTEIGGLNTISRLGNSEVFLEELDFVNFDFMLFSTLYQSGANPALRSLPTRTKLMFHKTKAVRFKKSKFCCKA